MKLTGTTKKEREERRNQIPGIYDHQYWETGKKIKTSFLFAVSVVLLGLWLSVITFPGISGGLQVGGVMDSPIYLPGVTCC